MSIQSDLSSLAHKIKVMRVTAPKSRNRHRELNSDFDALSAEVSAIAAKIGDLQKVCDLNMTLFESLIDLHDRNHVIVNPDCPKDIADFANDLFGNMRGLLAQYEAVK